MKLNYTHFLDFLFPVTEDEKHIRDKTPEMFLRKYNLQRMSNSTYALMSFKDQEVRAAIHLVKFHGHRHALSLLSAILTYHLQTLPPEHYILIPVPLSSARKRERGFNQVHLLAKESIKDFPLFTVHTDVLIKTRHTKAQSSLNKTQRRSNLSGAFVLTQNANEKLKNAHVILLDDVLTTGSTLREAQKTLAEAGPHSLICVALAH